MLTGTQIDAAEALQRGLVSRVYRSEALMPEALKMAQKIASLSRPVAIMAKESETDIGLRRKLIYCCRYK